MIWHAGSAQAAGLTFLYANAAASKQLGVTLDGALGKSVAELFPELASAPESYNVAEMWHRVAERQEREVMPAMRYGPLGQEPRWFNVYALPLGDRRVASVHEDIGDRMRAEHEIRGLNRELERSLDARQRRYHNIFNAAPVALCETDMTQLFAWLDGMRERAPNVVARLRREPDSVAAAAALWPILELNDNAARILGARGAHGLPSLGELVRNASENAWLELLAAIAERAPRFETELTLETYEGDKSVLLGLTIPREPADFANVVVSLFDISERKRLERELWSAQRLEAFEHLTGGVAHDFNNLLMIIGSYAGFLLEAFPVGDPAREDVKVIQDASSRAASLTNQLLAFSRRQVQQLEVIALDEVVSELQTILQRMVGDKIEVQTPSAKPLGLVKADRSQIQQILMNLAVNSRDAMPSGGKLVIATTNAQVGAEKTRADAEGPPAGAYVALTISDTGCGMDQEAKRRAFEPFFTTKGVGKGTGLGLSSVYGIVKQSQGYVTLESELGHGATFKIYLPRIDEEASVTRSRVAERDAAVEPRETVLLVEDEERVRTATRRILEKRGYRVLEAASGPQALALVAQHPAPIHLMVTDVMMPQMTGPELATQLAAERPEMKVVFVSGYTDNAFVRQAAARAGSAYVQKPFAPDALLRTVREMLDRQG
jgi:signal transduction histidine kinase/ActR/RegA family two-component response regulator